MKTLALVLGNNDYHDSAKLINAVNDAKGIADIFERLGYDVILKTDFNRDECGDILSELKTKLKETKYDACIFYFAGHGFEEKGENYLTSIDAQIPSTKEYLERTSIRLNEIFDILKENEIRINILIIDACRILPERGGSLKFSNIELPKGTIIAFSTSPNKGAYDNGFHEHSIYTGALLKHLNLVKDSISVEKLFKNVRKTVFDLSKGKQITWEHTSLIGDFSFNMNQIKYSLDIPYNEKVVKDTYYEGNETPISKIIMDLRSHNFYMQNSAINRLKLITLTDINKDDLFIIGRNILQSAEGGAFDVISFIENIGTNLKKYFTEDNENHLLNGILFEMYFNSLGEFRNEHFKKSYFEIIFSLRKDQKYSKAFEFIHKILLPYKDYLFYIPNASRGSNIDVNILAKSEKSTDFSGKEIFYQEIQSINISNKDIIDDIYRKNYDIDRRNEEELKDFLSHFIFAPKELINIISNIELTNIILRKKK